MESTTDQVAELQDLLVVKMVDVETEKKNTDELIEIVGRESEDAEKEQAAAQIQADETNALAAEANAQKAAANEELAEAKPAML